MSNTAPHDPLVIAGKTYRSRLLTGTGKFTDLEQTRLATEAAAPGLTADATLLRWLEGKANKLYERKQRYGDAL